ncbi:hypothetical protein DY000_02030362 [Brassica cretica]|uniref:Uncharacterized protein n=1 Tax=Brassica cretica TaxID=69181 RepID=A0ABQ7DUT6_BRACR|nr:hypothetical protein DY000_02030362 [Brassica cretica]
MTPRDSTLVERRCESNTIDGTQWERCRWERLGKASGILMSGVCQTRRFCLVRPHLGGRQRYLNATLFKGFTLS